VLASDSLYTDELLGRKISDESIVGLRLLLVRLRVMVVSNHLFIEFYYYSMNEQRKMKIFLGSIHAQGCNVIQLSKA
jgi:hypothetical protein